MVYMFLIEFAESLVYSPVNATGVVVLEPHWTKPSHGLDMESVKLNEAYKGVRFGYFSLNRRFAFCRTCAYFS